MALLATQYRRRRALYRYADLNRLALQAVRPGGLVVTSSCSGLVSEEAFLGLIRSAALDTRRAVRFLRISGAGADHPIAANFPEGKYLKTVFMTVGEEGSGPGNDPQDTQPDPRGRDEARGGGRGRDGDRRGPRRGW